MKGVESSRSSRLFGDCILGSKQIWVVCLDLVLEMPAFNVSLGFWTLSNEVHGAVIGECN